MKLTKAQNSKRTIVYYSLALISVIIGLYLKDARWYIIGIAFILLAFFRKFWLM